MPPLRLLQLQLLTIPALAAGAQRKEGKRKASKEAQTLGKPRAALLSLGDSGSPGACLCPNHCGGSPVAFRDPSRWQSPLSVVSSLWWLQVGS